MRVDSMRRIRVGRPPSLNGQCQATYIHSSRDCDSKRPDGRADIRLSYRLLVGGKHTRTMDKPVYCCMHICIYECIDHEPSFRALARTDRSDW